MVSTCLCELVVTQDSRSAEPKIDNAPAKREKSAFQRCIRFCTDGRLLVVAEQVVNSTVTVLGGKQAVPNVSQQANSFVRLRFQVVGANPTTLRLKAWADGQAEPSSWLYSATDSASSLQTAGAVGMRTYLSSTATNAPLVFSFDDFRATSVGI